MVADMRTLAPLCLAVFIAATPSAALAQEPLGPSAFREFAEGYTLYFELDGEPFGSEAFEPGGTTTWRYSDGSCLGGVWRPHGAQICFYYGEGTDVQCWRMIRDDQGLLMRLLGGGPDAAMELRIARRDRKKPICGEPGQGI